MTRRKSFLHTKSNDAGECRCYCTGGCSGTSWFVEGDVGITHYILTPASVGSGLALGLRRKMIWQLWSNWLVKSAEALWQQADWQHGVRQTHWGSNGKIQMSNAGLISQQSRALILEANCKMSMVQINSLCWRYETSETCFRLRWIWLLLLFIWRFIQSSNSDSKLDLN